MKITVKHCKKITLNRIIDDKDGVLSIAENMRQISFNISRVYFIYELDNSQAIRGMHAHKKLEQAIFCVKGSFKLDLDDGKTKESLILNQPHVGIYIGPGLWHTMTEFSIGCVILVLASDFYDESDYIRNYDDFIQYINRKKRK
jgi:dTDP-4-dehydrorhamnose 3,5-epimerase-like enzyme